MEHRILNALIVHDFESLRYNLADRVMLRLLVHVLTRMLMLMLLHQPPFLVRKTGFGVSFPLNIFFQKYDTTFSEILSEKISRS